VVCSVVRNAYDAVTPDRLRHPGRDGRDPPPPLTKHGRRPFRRRRRPEATFVIERPPRTSRRRRYAGPPIALAANLIRRRSFPTALSATGLVYGRGNFPSQHGWRRSSRRLEGLFRHAAATRRSAASSPASALPTCGTPVGHPSELGSRADGSPFVPPRYERVAGTQCRAQGH